MTTKPLSIAALAALSLIGCRDHRDLDFDRLGDHDILAGRSSSLGGSGISDADLFLGYIQARSGYLTPLRDTLRAEFQFHMNLLGDVQIGIPEGYATGYDPTGFDGTRGRRTTISTPSTVSLNVAELGEEYERTCLLQHLSSIAPVLWGGDRPCRMLNLDALHGLVDGVDVDVDSTNIGVAWVPPDTTIGEDARRPVLEIVLPTTVDTDPADGVFLDPTWTVDLAVRLQVRADTGSQPVRFERYRNDRPELGDLQFSDAGVALSIHVVHRNLMGDFQSLIAPTLDSIDRIAATLLDRLVNVRALDGAVATLDTWTAWCSDHFGSCPLASDVLQQIAAHSKIRHGDTLIQLPPRPDDPSPAPRHLAASGGRWTNDTIHALAEGATVTSATFDRSSLADRCTHDYADRCTGGTRDAFCSACDACSTPPAGAGALCDFATPLTITMSGGSGLPAMTIAPAPAFATLVDTGPNLGSQLYRVMNRPVDNYRAITGDNLVYSDVLFCPGATGCPSVPGPGAVFMLDFDYDRDGVSFHDNCPHTFNPSQVDTDDDGRGDACDGCPLVPSDEVDIDHDGTPDDCDCDLDGDTCNNEGVNISGGGCMANGQDGVFDEAPRYRNPRRSSGGYVDLDMDGFIDDCDWDDDGDLVPDTSDNCPRTANPGQEDSNSNGIGDACDPLCSSPSTCHHIDVIHDAAERFHIPGIDIGLDPIPLCLVDGPGCMIWWSIDELTGDLVGRSGFDREAVRITAKELGLPDLAGGAARIPDLDGDGIDDLAIASPHATSCDFTGCRKDTGIVVGIGSVKHGVLFELSTLGDGAELGTAMARVGSELWIGAPGERDAVGRPTGVVMRYQFRSGKPERAGLEFGIASGERFGAYLAAAGDQRVVIGAPNATGPQGKLAGRFDLLEVEGGIVAQAFGPGYGAGKNSRAFAAAKPFGEGLLVAWPAAAKGAGMVELFDAGGARKWRITGNAGDALGSSLTGPVDLDGDGFAHAICAAPGYEQGRGAVLTIDANGKLAPMVIGDATGAFATEVVSAGDLDGDGLPDLSVAAPGFAQSGALLHLAGEKH